MANKTILMSKIRQILRLYCQGTDKKQTSAITGVARNTIKKYIQKFISLKITYADIEAMDDHQLDSIFTPQQQVSETPGIGLRSQGDFAEQESLQGDFAEQR